jgi:hypothetical protein
MSVNIGAGGVQSGVWTIIVLEFRCTKIIPSKQNKTRKAEFEYQKEPRKAKQSRASSRFRSCRRIFLYCMRQRLMIVHLTMSGKNHSPPPLQNTSMPFPPTSYLHLPAKCIIFCFFPSFSFFFPFFFPSFLGWKEVSHQWVKMKVVQSSLSIC